MHRLSATIFYFSLLVCSVSNAADLIQVYQLAEQNDAHLDAARYEFKASSEAIDQAIAGLLPEISAEGTYTATEQNIVNSDNSVFDSAGSTGFTTTTYAITLNMPIFRYDAWVRFSQSYEIVKQAKAELLSAQQQLMFDTAEAYFKILAAKDNLEFSSAEREALQGQLELVKSKKEGGLVTHVDVLDTQSRFASSESKEIEAETSLDDAYRGLQEFTNQFINELLPLQEEMQLQAPGSKDIEAWLQLAYVQNYALQAKRHAISVAEEEKLRQFSGHLPTVDLVGSFNNRDTDGSLFGGGSEVETADIEVRLNVPLFQGGNVMSLTRQAEFNLSKTRREYEAERRSLERETRAALNGILSGIKKVEALKKGVKFQLSALEVKKEGLKAKVNTTLEVLDAQRDLYFSQREYSQARYDYLLSVLRLKKAVGTLNPDDLKSINQLLQG